MAINEMIGLEKINPKQQRLVKAANQALCGSMSNTLPLLHFWDS
ncbi:hypothetical protein [Sphingomonas bacterium]|nr:hypothetical protein [Sphingomonas bacterium]